MSIEDDEPITLSADPRFRVFEKNTLSILGRLLNPDQQSMSRMIADMPRHWRVYNRVRGIALSKDKFQFIFDREEDLQTVLNDRPWSFNHWTMLLERWTANPPDDFLTKFEVWIRIRNIPYNYYTIDTMNELAKAIGKVEEIAFDPNVSHKSDFTRAKVLFDISKPARDEKILNIKDEKPVTIAYEYERIRKKCFHCFRLTHEKPQCPLLKKPHRRNVSNVHTPAEPSALASKKVLTKPPGMNYPDGPPSFPPMFPELFPFDRQQALMYISHPDEKERMARIQRVQLSIADKRSEEDNAMPVISYDLNKTKGWSLVMRREVTNSRVSVLKGLNDALLHPWTFLRMNLTAGVSSLLKKPRNRPPSWKRKARASTKPTSTSVISLPEEDTDNGKRKAESSGYDSTKRSNLNQDPTVASVLKPLPPQ
ncbi:uncharacterized protein LOC106378374 [Brassica napus]|uniref:uncharacterized protein LOC106324195 n=1 Tax=Brassica oleracea var. oleracea TaxID=109376 RepID=UPI0006A6B76A|nr:PREDICTED: uncharacterized protein LOC106324195 [Brassica oleracea var. oleracea]XP_048605080.1 uncharacterized protein LOC106378374 [Brassica napus]